MSGNVIKETADAYNNKWVKRDLGLLRKKNEQLQAENERLKADIERKGKDRREQK